MAYLQLQVFDKSSSRIESDVIDIRKFGGVT
jgi:hypothetical protein